MVYLFAHKVNYEAAGMASCYSAPMEGLKKFDASKLSFCLAAYMSGRHIDTAFAEIDADFIGSKNHGTGSFSDIRSITPMVSVVMAYKYMSRIQICCLHRCCRVSRYKRIKKKGILALLY
ncbi:hypothetical protein SDC9_111900 [bioreactor metagenome]|uniref:Uncharacterized protein n=1 Tax=bioreactor metagenome TaxID=1076179 RepID=A0A645BIU5_9ZZZZ